MAERFTFRLDAVQLQQVTIINLIRTGFNSPHPHGPPSSILTEILEEVDGVGCAVFPGRADCEELDLPELPDSVTE